MNNKGYMLVEIILASAIAFTLAWFVISLTLKLKNKNDDTLVETLVKTDQAIAMNKIMELATEKREKLCEPDVPTQGVEDQNTNVGFEILNRDDSNLLVYSYFDGTVRKTDTLLIFNKYVNVTNSDLFCKAKTGNVKVKIKLDVPQMPNKMFDIDVDYKYKINDMAFPQIDIEDMDVEEVEDGYTYAQKYPATLTIYDNEGLKSDQVIKLRYDWLASSLPCEELKNVVDIKIDKSPTSHDNITYENVEMSDDVIVSETVKLDIQNITGNGRLYVCNENEIEDISGNKTPSTIFSADGANLYLDSEVPTCTINIVKNSNNVAKINLTGTDNVGVSSYSFSAGQESYKYVDFADAATDIITIGNNVEANYIFAAADSSFKGQIIDGDSLTFYGSVIDTVGNKGTCSLTIYKYNSKANPKCAGGSKISNLNFCK